MRSSFVDIDRGYKRFKRSVKSLKGDYTKVGIQQGSDLGERDIGEMVTIGSVHEFGAPKRNIPERSFMRTSFDENMNSIFNLQVQLLEKAKLGIISSKEALSILGEYATTKVKKKIKEIKHPPLKNPSKRRSGGGVPNPLIDTGQMINSITHVEVLK